MQRLFRLLFCVMLLIASPTFGQTLDEVQQSIKNSFNSMLSGLDVKKFTATPQRDLLTLGIGGVAGFTAGSLFSSLGLVRIEVLGVALIPVVSGLAGIYFANEGYFDSVRDAVETK